MTKFPMLAGRPRPRQRQWGVQYHSTEWGVVQRGVVEQWGVLCLVYTTSCGKHAPKSPCRHDHFHASLHFNDIASEYCRNLDRSHTRTLPTTDRHIASLTGVTDGARTAYLSQRIGSHADGDVYSIVVGVRVEAAAYAVLIVAPV